MKEAYKETIFEIVETVMQKARETMNNFTENDLKHCFEKWKIQMEGTVDGIILKVIA